MTRDDALLLADKILALVNAQPSTPTRDEIVEVIVRALPERRLTVGGMLLMSGPKRPPQLGKKGQSVEIGGWPSEPMEVEWGAGVDWSDWDIDDASKAAFDDEVKALPLPSGRTVQWAGGFALKGDELDPVESAALNALIEIHMRGAALVPTQLRPGDQVMCQACGGAVWPEEATRVIRFGGMAFYHPSCVEPKS